MSEEDKGFILKESTDKDSDSGKKDGDSSPLPEVNFSTFIFSLNSSALVLLGKVGDPITGGREVNLPTAKQTIDIIDMLEIKTRGNLTDDEAKLIQSILHELRLIYVKEKS